MKLERVVYILSLKKDRFFMFDLPCPVRNIPTIFKNWYMDF